MIGRAALLLLLAPLALRAQLVLFGPDGSHVGASFSLGQVPANTPKDFVFHATNTGSAALSVTTLSISGAGLTIADSPSPPFVIDAQKTQAITIHFAGGPPAGYSANFQINSTSVVVVVVSVPAPALAAIQGCTGPDAGGIIAFGQIQAGQSAACTLSLQNANPQTVTVDSIAVTGSAFALAKPVATPLTLQPGQTAGFSIHFTPASASVYTGSLAVDSQMFQLTGTAINAPLPKPILELDPGALASGQNRIISMRLPSGSPLAASGSVNLSFQPDSTLISDDPAIVFAANNARSIPFTIHPGDLNINLGGEQGAVFQTGTSSGRIVFTVTADVPLSGDPTTVFVIPPSVIGFPQSVSAIARAGALDVQVLGGFDNTYSAGSMSFTFYDISGNVMQPSPVQADFTKNFRSYFTTLGGGSAFQMLVSFPVTGQANRIGAVDFAMTNSAGATPTQHLGVINDTGQCTTVGVSEILCPQTPPP